MSSRPGQRRKEKAPSALVSIFGFQNVAAICGFVLVTYVSMLATQHGLNWISKEKYNDAPLFTAQKNSDGSTSWNIVTVTDLDKDSKLDAKKWQAIIKQGTLTLGADGKTASVSWRDADDFAVSSNIAAGGRSMELSDFAVFDGKLLSCDDRSGLVYQIKNKKAIPWVLLNDGPGDVTKGLKAEWMTVKDGRLVVGGLGKEWTTTEGEYVNDHPMWVKIVAPNGAVEHVPWKDAYVAARRAAGIEYPGYMIHEAVQWSELHRSWFFLPRRASTGKYSEADDEHRGTNKLIIGNERLTDFRVVEVGSAGDGARGFSGFQFVPGSADNLIIALKSEEKNGDPVGSYVTVFDISGRVLLADQRLEGSHKFEGVAFVDL